MSDSHDVRAAPVNAPIPAAIETGLDAHGYDPADYDWVPVLRKPRADGWSPQRQRAFIGHLADCGSVATAAQRSGMSTSGAYKLRRSPEGQAFAHAWDAAIQQAAHALVDAAFERAINGSEEPVWDRTGRVIGRRFRQSDGLMMFLLRKHFPDRYGDLYRDRPEQAVAPPAPPVADTMIALGPVVPADPLALMHPDDAEIKLQCAEIMDGQLARWHRQDGTESEPYAAVGLGPGFDAELEAARRQADPAGHAFAEATRAEAAALDEEQEERRDRARRRRGACRTP